MKDEQCHTDCTNCKDAQSTRRLNKNCQTNCTFRNNYQTTFHTHRRFKIKHIKILYIYIHTYFFYSIPALYHRTTEGTKYESTCIEGTTCRRFLLQYAYYRNERPTTAAAKMVGDTEDTSNAWSTKEQHNPSKINVHTASVLATAADLCKANIGEDDWTMQQQQQHYC